MSKVSYHFSPNLNEPRPCKDPARCAFGSDTKHYDSPEQYYAEEAANAGTGTTNTIKVDSDEDARLRRTERAEAEFVAERFNAGEFGDSFTTGRRGEVVTVTESQDRPSDEYLLMGDNGELETEDPEWEVMSGFSNAGRDTKLMHPSEQIDGGPADYMAKNPGTYHTITVDAEDEDGETDIVGWALLRKKDAPAAETDAKKQDAARAESMVVSGFFNAGEFGDSYTTDRRNGMLHIQKSTDHPAEESVMLGDDGEPEPESSGWTVMNGFSNANKTTGLMHPSEQIDGGPADYMAQNPGTYQTVVVDAEDEDGDGDAVGWALLRKDEDIEYTAAGDSGAVYIRAEGRRYVVEAINDEGEPAGQEVFDDLEQAKEQHEAYRVQLEDE